MGARWDKQSVEKIVIAVERIVAGGKFDVDGVSSGSGCRRGNGDVVFRECGADQLATGLDARNTILRPGEIQHDRMRGPQHEPDRGRSPDRIRASLRDGKPELVTQRGDS